MERAGKIVKVNALAYWFVRLRDGVIQSVFQKREALQKGVERQKAAGLEPVTMSRTWEWNAPL